jgi:hypothetical protein
VKSQAYQEVAQQPEQRRNQNLLEQTGHMRQERNCEQGGEKQPIKKLKNLSRIINNVFQD